MKHVRRICAVLLATVVLLPLVLLCVQAFVPPFDALMISTGSEPLHLLPVPFPRSSGRCYSTSPPIGRRSGTA